jgi:hypothetical protein
LSRSSGGDAKAKWWGCRGQGNAKVKWWGSGNPKVKWRGSRSKTRRRGLEVKVKKKGGQIVLLSNSPYFELLKKKKSRL